MTRCLHKHKPGSGTLCISRASTSRPYLARTYALVGRRDDALRVLNGLAKQGGAFDLEEMAIAYFALGDKDRGFEWLARAFDQRSGFVAWTNVQPGLDGVRSDPRFKALVARLKLPGQTPISGSHRGE